MEMVKLSQLFTIIGPETFTLDSDHPFRIDKASLEKYGVKTPQYEHSSGIFPLCRFWKKISPDEYLYMANAAFMAVKGSSGASQEKLERLIFRNKPMYQNWKKVEKQIKEALSKTREYQGRELQELGL